LHAVGGDLWCGAIHLVPMLDRHLTGDNGRSALVAIVDDFEEITTLVAGERSETPVVVRLFRYGGLVIFSDCILEPASSFEQVPARPQMCRRNVMARQRTNTPCPHLGKGDV
jgi:hypothetical protein